MGHHPPGLQRRVGTHVMARGASRDGGRRQEREAGSVGRCAVRSSTDSSSIRSAILERSASKIQAHYRGKRDRTIVEARVKAEVTGRFSARLSRGEPTPSRSSTAASTIAALDPASATTTATVADCGDRGEPEGEARAPAKPDLGVDNQGSDPRRLTSAHAPLAAFVRPS